MEIIKRMPIDVKGLQDKLESNESQIQHLQGLVEKNEQLAGVNQKAKPVYFALVRQYENEIHYLQGENARLENQIRGVKENDRA